MKKIDAFLKSKAKTAESSGSETEQLGLMKEGAVAENEFIEELKELVVKVAKKRNYCLWSAPEQALLKQEIIALLKGLPLWAAGDPGLQHNVEVAIRLRNLGLQEDFVRLCDNSPSVREAIATLQSADENFGATTEIPAGLTAITTPARSRASSEHSFQSSAKAI